MHLKLQVRKSKKAHFETSGEDEQVPLRNFRWG
jgi:hypothetical protein